MFWWPPKINGEKRIKLLKLLFLMRNLSLKKNINSNKNNKKLLCELHIKWPDLHYNVEKVIYATYTFCFNTFKNKHVTRFMKLWFINENVCVAVKSWNWVVLYVCFTPALSFRVSTKSTIPFGEIWTFVLN
jgi:hypothetical protein